jgi:hypothetical protein
MQSASRVAVASVTVLLAAACSSSPSSVVRPGGPLSSTSSRPAVPTPSPSATRTTAAHPHVTITPSRALRNRQTVHVHGTGFTPGTPLTVVECAVKGQATGPGDCNLPAMVSVTADAAGRVAVDTTALRGPFGANRIACTARQRCLISVTEASLSPSEEADAVITFAGG